jgi:hypothetical protein
MTTLSELIGRGITPEAKGHNTPRMDILSAPIPARSEQADDQYEAAVFNFLLANKEELAIKDVVKFTALLLDGGVALLEDERLTVEVKYRMNWEKACQAEWQFRTFLKRTDAKPFSADGGIVIFEEFSSDWGRIADCRFLENGWSHWYRGHSEVDGLRLHLLRLRFREGPGKLEGFPIAEAVMAKINTLSPEERSRLLAGLAGEGG